MTVARTLKPAAGAVDAVHGIQVEGWTYDPAAPFAPSTVVALDGRGREVGRARTGLQRPDVVKAGHPPAGHGFSLTLAEPADGDLFLCNLGDRSLIPGSPIEAPRHWPALTAMELAGLPDRPRAQGSLLLLSPIDWSFRFQRPQYLALFLARAGFDVLFVQPRLAMGRRNAVALEAQPAPRVAVLRLHTPEIAFRPDAVQAATAAAFADLLDGLSPAAPRRWALAQHPLWHDVLAAMAETRIAVDVLDDYAAMERVEQPEALERLNAYLRRGERWIATADDLADRAARALGVRPPVVMNGASGLFAEVPLRATGDPARLTLGYVGAVDWWFDEALLLSVLAARPGWRCVVVGAAAPGAAARLARHRQVEMTGEVDHFALPALVGRFDVAVVPFAEDAFSRTINPVKVFEFLAAGLPVVATGIRPDPAFGDTAVVSGRERFIAAVERFAANDEPAARQRRRDAMKAHGWAERAAAIVKLLQQ